MTLTGPDGSSPPPSFTLPGQAATTFTAQGDAEIVVTRQLHASRQLVFAAWTDPVHLRRWLGRADWTMTVCQSDPRPRGIRRFVWRRCDGSEMGMRGAYREVTPPSGFTCTEKFDGGPGETFHTLLLAERRGRTEITSTIRYHDSQARDAALATTMRTGFTESLTRLAEHLRLNQNAADVSVRRAPTSTQEDEHGYEA